MIERPDRTAVAVGRPCASRNLMQLPFEQLLAHPTTRPWRSLIASDLDAVATGRSLGERVSAANAADAISEAMAKAIASGRCIFMLYLSKVKRNKQKDRTEIEPVSAP